MNCVNHSITQFTLIQEINETTTHRYYYPDKNAINQKKPELNFTKHVTLNISRQVRTKENGQPKSYIKFLLGFR